MRFTTETKVFITIILIAVAMIGIGTFLMVKPATPLSRDILITPQTATRGNPQAELTLVEFSDFQCPACKAAQPIVDAVVEKYKDVMVFAYRHMPLDQHAFSKVAAASAEAAGRQGKYWEMYALLFDNQEKLNSETIIDLARSLELDMNQYSRDATDSAILAQIEADKSYGLSIGVSGTPTFFLNGRKLNLTSFKDLEKEIEKNL